MVPWCSMVHLFWIRFWIRVLWNDDVWGSGGIPFSNTLPRIVQTVNEEDFESSDDSSLQEKLNQLQELARKM